MLGLANAKINIGLYVTEKLASGYHNIQSVLYPVPLYDAVELTNAPVTGFTGHGLPVPGPVASNLCVKAYNLIASQYNLPPQHISLLKVIPMGAGLGGGSSNAATVLKLANKKFRLMLPVQELQNLAARLGSDCPFFIQNTPALATGTGTTISPLPLSLSGYRLALIVPPVHISTQMAYSAISPAPANINLHQLPGIPLTGYKTSVFNHFEYLFNQFPQLGTIKNHLYAAGAAYASLSGSGSTVYGIFHPSVQMPPLGHLGKTFFLTLP